MRIWWVEPVDNYDAITRYEVQIQTAEGTFRESTETCDGADETIRLNTECWVPLTTLIGGDFGLQQGEPVVVRLAATNNIGVSEFTQIDGVLVETVPLKPNPVFKGAGTTDLQIHVQWDPVTDFAETGGSAVVSYRLDWDDSSNELVWHTIAGHDTSYPFLLTEFTKTLTTPGNYYKFRLQVENR